MKMLHPKTKIELNNLSNQVKENQKWCKSLTELTTEDQILMENEENTNQALSFNRFFERSMATNQGCMERC